MPHEHNLLCVQKLGGLEKGTSNQEGHLSPVGKEPARKLSSWGQKGGDAGKLHAWQIAEKHAVLDAPIRSS